MLLGILSDTHNEVARTQRAVAMLQEAGADALIHCGDLSDTPIVTICSVLPFYFVFGNHDADNVAELKRAAVAHGATCLEWGGTVTVADKKIGVVHGHLTMDIRKVLTENPSILLSGHTHYPFDTFQGTLRRINPGALFRTDEYTVALLNLISSELRILKLAY